MARWQELTEESAAAMPPGDLQLWKFRSTLLRVKRPERVKEPPPGRKHPRGKLLDPKNPPEPPFTCDPDCETCFPQFFPVVHGVDNAVAKSTIDGLVDDILSNWNFLRDTISGRADTLVNKWRKKSKIKRLTFLTEQTDLFPKKWAAVCLLDAFNEPEGLPSDIFKNEPANDMQPEVKEALAKMLFGIVHKTMTRKMVTDMWQDTWLLPYLDAESLAEEPLRFLSLLYNRTIRHPQEWVMFDNSQLVLAEQVCAHMPEYNPNCVVMQGPRFGRLVRWSAERAHRWEIVGYNKAHTILCAQQKMMNLLRVVVTGLLDGIDDVQLSPTPPSHPKWDQLIRNGFATFGSSTPVAWSTYINQPFMAPPELDPVKLLDTVTSRYRAAADELWLLQTDPAYVQLLVRDFWSTTFSKKIDEEGRWECCLWDIVLHALHRECYWRQMLEESKLLVERYDDLRREPNSKAARQHYDVMLWIMQDFAMEFLAVQFSWLNDSMPLQHGFQVNYEYSSKSADNGEKHAVIKSRDYFTEDPLFWSLSCIGFDEYRSFTMEPALHLRVLDDHLAHASAKESGRLGQGLYDRVDDMAVVDEVFVALRCYPKRNRQPLDDMLRDMAQEPLRSEWLKKIKTFSTADDDGRLRRHLKNLCTENVFPQGKRDETWLLKAECARKSLSRFWMVLRTEWKANLLAGKVSSAATQEDIHVMSADKSSHYLEEIDEERRTIKALMVETRKAQQSGFLDVPISRIAGQENQSLLLETVLRTKVKTRRSLMAETSEKLASTSPATVAPHCDPPSPRGLVSVKRESLSIFMHMFPSSGNESTRRFAWQHFLNAMIDAGFAVTQGSGSAVSFKQHTLDNDCAESGGRIVFHRPHPEPNIDPVMLQSMGRRMRKWFGWHRGVFQERVAPSPKGA